VYLCLYVCVCVCVRMCFVGLQSHSTNSAINNIVQYSPRPSSKCDLCWEDNCCCIHETNERVLLKFLWRIKTHLNYVLTVRVWGRDIKHSSVVERVHYYNSLEVAKDYIVSISLLRQNKLPTLQNTLPTLCSCSVVIRIIGLQVRVRSTDIDHEIYRIRESISRI